MRLDIYVSGLLGISRSQAQKQIKAGEVIVNGDVSKTHQKVVQGDVVAPSERKERLEKSKNPIVNIMYEDENIIVVDKSKGVVVYPAVGHKSGTLVDALIDKIDITDSERPGVIHRLDKDTSGLLVLAKNKKTEEYLKKEIKERKFNKVYLVLVWGKVSPRDGTIDIPIKRSEKDRKKMEAAHTGREAFTKYEVIKYYDKMTLLKARIITGRTHQIRVHFSAIGYPVVGDKTYGKKGTHVTLNRQFLHAHQLSFDLFGKKYSFTSELPKDLSDFIAVL